MPRSLPPRIGLRYATDYYATLVAERPDIAFLVVDAEDYMIGGGPHLRRLEALRERLPLSLHSNGLAIGAARPLDREHLDRLVALAARLRPGAVSEHLAWASPGVTDPLAGRLKPYSRRTLQRTAAHVEAIQDRLGQPLLIESPLTCMILPGSTCDDGGFLAALAARTGCRLLLNLGNVVFSARPRHRDLLAHLASFPLDRVEEVHLPAAGAWSTGCAGDAVEAVELETTWGLYAWFVRNHGRHPTAIDWEPPAPALDRLLEAAADVTLVMASADGAGHARAH